MGTSKQNENIEESLMVHISCGNRKLDKSIGIINQPAIKTCPNNSMCNKTCYAMKAERIYKSARQSRENNYQASLLPTFVQECIHSIKKSKRTVIRIHEAGDFYSQAYANKWNKIIKALPDIKFYAYTKSMFLPKETDNFRLIHSILPDGELNYGSHDYIENLRLKYGFHVCPVKVGSGQLCGRDCMVCFNTNPKYVLFIKH